ncbi:MAG: glycosyltransferase family 2 protein [Pirellulales bacterium]|nr:glycosyltransferase family 2 protein [Pirellulales bacterium]
MDRQQDSNTTSSRETLESPLLSVVIPVFNEVRTIDRILAAVRSVELDTEIIVVDDFSTDGTRDQLARFNRDDPRLRIFYHDRNQGKGAALRKGFAAARGKFVVVQDADLEYDPREYPKLLQPLLEDKADVVFGSRFAGSDNHRVLYFWHAVGNRLLSLLSNMCTNLNMTDIECCYKVFRCELLQQISLREDRFGFEPEIVAKIARYRGRGEPLRIYEIGISYYGRTYDEGKKIGWKDGMRALWCILKYNLLDR